MKPYLSLLILFLMVVAPTHAKEDPLVVSQLSGKIAYANEDDVYVMNADGSQPTRLTTDPAADFDPSWSPDGKRIAFRSHRDGDEEIYVMNADGTDQVNLSNFSGADWSPAWSPNGTQIAFSSQRSGDHFMNLYVIHPDGSGLTNLTQNQHEGEYPSWSPDGKRIAFACYRGGITPPGTEPDYNICAMDADGSNQAVLSDNPAYEMHPAWSPDGTKIAFMSERDGWPSLPDYVPPAYDGERRGDAEIYVMNADGSNPINLTQNPRSDDSMPVWSRDGLILFTRYGCLMVMRSDGSGLSRITHSASCIGFDEGQFPDWFQTL